MNIYLLWQQYAGRTDSHKILLDIYTVDTEANKTLKELTNAAAMSTISYYVEMKVTK